MISDILVIFGIGVIAGLGLCLALFHVADFLHSLPYTQEFLDKEAEDESR